MSQFLVWGEVVETEFAERRDTGHGVCTFLITDLWLLAVVPSLNIVMPWCFQVSSRLPIHCLVCWLPVYCSSVPRWMSYSKQILVMSIQLSSLEEVMILHFEKPAGCLSSEDLEEISWFQQETSTSVLRRKELPESLVILQRRHWILNHEYWQWYWS